MNPLDEIVHYGKGNGTFEYPIQSELFPDKVQVLRSKLHHKAKTEPKFRFYALYDRIYRNDVLEAAWKQVAKRGKAAGIDGVKAEDLLDREGAVEDFLDRIHEELRTKEYRASPVLRVYIPKGDGKERPLGIPTLKDRVVQMATLLVLEPIFEADFLECSHGFRPGRSAHGAIEEIRQNIRQGRSHIYDADLKGYFDTIPHDKLMACAGMRVTDRSVLGLLRQWLRAPIIERREGKIQPPKANREGTPQGGVISPLLANLYLHWFDKKFHANDGPRKWANARLVRYADDFVILASYQGMRIEEWVRSTLEDWQGLQINSEKTQTIDLKKGEKLDFLGFTFRFDRDLYEGKTKYLNLEPSKKSQKKARKVVKEKTIRSKGYQPIKKIVEDLNGLLRGWGNYFGIGYPRKSFRKLNYYTQSRLIRHLKRRSQRKHKLKGKDQSYTDYFYHEQGLHQL